MPLEFVAYQQLQNKHVKHLSRHYMKNFLLRLCENLEMPQVQYSVDTFLSSKCHLPRKAGPEIPTEASALPQKTYYLVHFFVYCLSSLPSPSQSPQLEF